MKLESWFEAWSTYGAVLSARNRDLASDLFQYQAFITRSSLHFQLYAWLQYDIQFRFKLAANSSLRWASTDTELVATWLSADAAKHTASCFSCGCPDHLSADCPLRPTKSLTAHCLICKASGHIARDCPQLASDKRSKSGPKPKDDKYCRIYNRRGSCFRGSKCTLLSRILPMQWRLSTLCLPSGTLSVFQSHHTPCTHITTAGFCEIPKHSPRLYLCV